VDPANYCETVPTLEFLCPSTAKYGGEKSSSKICCMVDSHATSNPVISDVKREKNRIKTESLSLNPQL